MKVSLKKTGAFVLLIAFICIKFYFVFKINSSNGFSSEKISISGDAAHYLEIAKNIAQYNVYSDNNSVVATESATWRPPFWPFLLSFLYAVSTTVFSIVMLKSILEIVCIGLILFQFKKFSKLTFAYMIPFLLVFNEPQYLKYSSTLLSESFTSILILFLSVCFICLNKHKSYNLFIPVVSTLVIICHPVSIFFVGTLFIIYFIFNLKSSYKRSVVHGVLFLALLLVWPCRNYITFNKGIYLTASQGATFSKGWNKNVASQFTNVDGDLADETLNLELIGLEASHLGQASVLDLSKLYTKATFKFISSIEINEVFKIMAKKILSNFNPFPEKPKAGFLEYAAVVARFFYIILFIQLIRRLFEKTKFNIESITDKMYLIVLSVFIGQLIMSVYVYTGLRFNAIYGLTLLFCFIGLNRDYFDFIISKLNNKYV